MKKMKILIGITMINICLFVACGSENQSPLPTQSGIAAFDLVGQYYGIYYATGTSKAGKLAVEIVDDRFASGVHVLSGSVTLGGATPCFQDGRFLGDTGTASYSESSRTGSIEASGQDGSKAILFFTVSADSRQLQLQGGDSKFLDSRGDSCLKLEPTVLTKRAEPAEN